MTTAVDDFVSPLIGATAWGVRQGYGSFLYFNFGEPKLVIHERTSKRLGKLVRHADVEGASHIWINCCHWRARDAGRQIAHSEDSRETIDSATAFLNGQKLIAIDVEGGRSAFRFDLDGLLETWPYEENDAREQWTIFHEGAYFDYRGDGLFRRSAGDTVPSDDAWLSLV